MRSRMLALLVVGGVAAAAPAVAGVTSVAVQPLPANRTGVVVDWRVQSGTATVALRSGRLLAVHSMRRLRPGTRVQVEGIKWGRPTSGIKWSAAPQGVQWGIKWSRNGTYSSNLRTIGRADRTALRGVVVRRFGGGVAIGTRGGIVVVRMAVWLPNGGTKTTNARALPMRGDTITTNVRIGPRGRLHGDGARIVTTNRVPVIPVSGRLTAKDTASRTIRVSNVSDTSYPVHTRLAVPSTIDMTLLTVGDEVVVAAGMAPDGALRANQIAPNETFAAGNNPANIQIAPLPADADTLALLRRAIDRWSTARTQGAITDQTVYDVELARLQRADAAARDGNRPGARTELDAFITEVMAALPDKVTPGVATDVLSLASAALDRLG